jgi:hypothetical protein
MPAKVILNLMNDNTLNVLAEVSEERGNQDRRWGQQNHPRHRFNSILCEEYLEAVREINDDNQKQARAELIQVAAVAVAMVEAMDRGNW